MLIFIHSPALRGAAAAFAALALAAAEPNPAGIWRTYDDRTHEPRGTVKIFEDHGVYKGKIESSLDPEDARAICSKCPGDRRNEKLIGLEIIRGLTRHGSEYSGGEVLDPETGMIYHCKLTVDTDNRKLYVRGYFGFSLLGRTQTWVRVE